ncbi:hypothetical protein PF011_g30230 [Phytophthora fragariae]|uniref:Pectate lyase n=1 Tax=Phytophthora fragariae TaxID=53985 RepID=A0A6A3GSR6_9STRA|nr:hypothetical protein PF011_g30230 [Phytophthora fragariae]
MPLYNKGEEGALYVAGSEDECQSLLGRSCVPNELVNSGNFSSRNGETALETIKSVPTFVEYTSDATANDSEQEQQQQVQQPAAGTVKPSAETSQSSIQASDVESMWGQTTDNFGIGKLD